MKITEQIEILKKSNNNLSVILFDKDTEERVMSYGPTNLIDSVNYITNTNRKQIIRICFDLTFDESNINELNIFDHKVNKYKSFNLYS